MFCREAVKKRFPSLEIGYSIVNLYQDAGDVTEWHRDNYFGMGNSVSLVGVLSGVLILLHCCFFRERTLSCNHAGVLLDLHTKIKINTRAQYS